jgi:uncharacterized protein (TIGR02118 family)
MTEANGGTAMFRISVLYPNEPGKKFDLDYYVNKHIPLAERLLRPAGMVKVEVDRAADANAPFIAVAHLYFNSVDDFQKAFAVHAAEFITDSLNYTDIALQVQISEIVK